MPSPRATAEALRDMEERSFDAVGASLIPLRLRWRGQPARLAAVLEGWGPLERSRKGDENGTQER